MVRPIQTTGLGIRIEETEQDLNHKSDLICFYLAKSKVECGTVR
jgi:hypothetical protein